jgi:hypothetical protein
MYHKKSYSNCLTIEQSIKFGGLKMPNIFLKVQSWQLSWLKRSIINQNAQWLVVINKLLVSVKLQDLMSSSLDKNSSILQKLPTFYKNILINWNEIKNEYGKASLNDVLLWHNNNIRINNIPLLLSNIGTATTFDKIEVKTVVLLDFG